MALIPHDLHRHGKGLGLSPETKPLSGTQRQVVNSGGIAEIDMGIRPSHAHAGIGADKVALISYRSVAHRIADEICVAPIWHLFGT